MTLVIVFYVLAVVFAILAIFCFIGGIADEAGFFILAAIFGCVVWFFYSTADSKYFEAKAIVTYHKPAIEVLLTQPTLDYLIDRKFIKTYSLARYANTNYIWWEIKTHGDTVESNLIFRPLSRDPNEIP